MTMLSSIATFYREGGPFMHAILLVGVAILAIGAERFWVIARAASVNHGKLLRDALQKLAKGEASGAADLCRRTGGPVGHVGAAILSRHDADEASLQNAADGAATLALPRLSRRLQYLNILANVATLLGLLGTIFGLTTAFSAVSAADPAQRSAFLAVGIAQALNTTAFGLIVAVPTLILHGFLVSKVESVVDAIDEASVRLIEAVTRRGVRAA